MQFKASKGQSLTGTIRVPGDKSISHRSIMFGSLADGVTEVSGFLPGEDCLATLRACREMGVRIEQPQLDEVIIHGVGIDGLQAPEQALDLGNSGTSMRLMAGLLAGQAFDTTLTGDESLSGRPMRRVTNPLADMGAVIETTEQGTAPLYVKGEQALTGLGYISPVASAQVKSSLLLAGLYAEGRTTITEPGITRDHTERMLQSFGYDVETREQFASLQGGGRLTAAEIKIPADISSAAFFLVAGSIIPGSDILLTDVGMNPTRTGVLDILKLMGANITVQNERLWGAEPVADLHVQATPLKGIQIPEHLVPLAIDEFPALFIAAAVADGQTTLTGAEELRVKESDRIQVMANGLNATGINAKATPDGMVIEGNGQFTDGTVDSHGDHRIAMSFAVAAQLATGILQINDCANVNTSFPGFVELAQQAGMQLQSV